MVKPPKKSTTKTLTAPSTPAFSAVPSDYRPQPTPRDNDVLLDMLKAILASDGQITAALVEAFSDDEYGQVWVWAREIDWAVSTKDDLLADGTLPAARVSMLTVPACWASRVASDLASPETLIDNGEIRLIDDRPEAPGQVAGTDPISPEEQAAEKVVEQAASSLTQAPAEAKQLDLVTESTPKKPLKPLEFVAGDEMASVRLALTARAEDLEAESKRLNGLGKSAEATSVLREAKNIKERLLPQVTSQGALPFNEKETLAGAVSRVVQGEIRSRARRALTKSLSIKKGETKQDAEQRELAKLDDLESLIGNIGEQAGGIVTKFIVEAADRGNQYGLRGMQAEASVIARDAIHAIEAELRGAEAA